MQESTRKHLTEIGWFVGIAAALLLVVSWFNSSDDDAKEPGGTRAASLPPLNLTYRFSPGQFFTHDLYVSNTSGQDLSEVNISFTFVGEDGSPRADRYWSSWSLGEEQHIEVPADSVSNVQRIVVKGRADQGIVEGELRQR